MNFTAKVKKVVAAFCTSALAIAAAVPSGFVGISAAAAEDEYSGNYKTDVWDFGAEALDTATYNNMLTVDDINGFYPAGTAAGSSGIAISSFTTKDGQLEFNGGGKSNHRIRTTNESITRYDSKSLTFEDVTYTGYVYSNASSTKDVYLAVKLYKGDTLTVITGSNGGESAINCESPDGSVQIGNSNSKGARLTFYAAETGMYKLYSTNEKLVVYRVYREHSKQVTVNGKVDTSEASGLSDKDYSVSFTNTKTGDTVEAKVTNGSYSASLSEGFTYDIALVNANGYVIKSAKTLDVAKGASSATMDVTVAAVDLVNITGKITGIDADKLANLALTFDSKSVYVPEILVSGDSFTLKVEKGVTYSVKADGVNDFELKTTTFKADADGTKNIEFSKKPVYAVTLNLKGLSDSAKANASVEFANIKEEGYSYKFKANDKIELRDGQYSVKVTGTGAEAVVQKLTADLKVNGKAVTKDVEFEKVEVWDFAKYNGGKPGIDADKKHYMGLGLTNASENKTYLLVNPDGEVKVPVKKGQNVTISFCYSGEFEIDGKTYTVDVSEGSTSKADVVTVSAKSDGELSIKVSKQTYFNSISAVSPTAYKSTVTVGKGKNYQTINEALAAVAKMNRPNNERVKIVIDPGDYEEMLVVNVPNVSLVNAAGKNSSLELTDKGVNIGKNVVRITSYYGHGYNYYSMGSDCKWNADVLAANKSNGSLTKENPGSGTTDGSYWNATVVVSADGFEADGIVFENSFNQYISKKEAADIVKAWDVGAPKGGARPTKAGDTSVQDKKYVERAAAMAILGDESVFVNCKFIGRQDTLYGNKDIKAAFHKCDILGATDYIFGGMTAVFYKCDLVMNTSADNNDVAYLTAAQQDNGRGYLMYECTVTSTTPGKDTASETRSKPGYFGRPWQAKTSEVVFFNTTIETTDFAGSEGKSLILPLGWNNSLGGESDKMYEFGTTEKSGEDNLAQRAAWATNLDEAKIDGEDITIDLFLGDEWTQALQARGILTENAPTVSDKDNPDTGVPVVPIAAAAAAGAAALLLSKKKRK